MLIFEFGQNRFIRKKILVIATPTGFEWIFQTCPIDLKFCKHLEDDKCKLNSEFGQKPIIKKKSFSDGNPHWFWVNFLNSFH